MTAPAGASTGLRSSSGDARPALSLALAGVPQLRAAGQPLATGTRKALALAVMAALEPSLRRSRAADLLWPDTDPSAARRNVRRDLYRLRQAGLPLADEAGEALRLPAVQLQWPRPAALPPRWLDGLDEVAGAEFAHWVAATRQRLQRQWIDALQAEAEALEHAAQPEAALLAWRALLADGVAGPGFAAARAAVQRLASEASTLEASAAPPEPPPPTPLPQATIPQTIPFHGRVVELNAIGQAIELGRPLLVDGAPGVGKTRLVMEALSRRGPVLAWRCRPEDIATPYASASRALQVILALGGTDAVPAWARRDLAALVPAWRSRGPSDAEGMPEPQRLQRAWRTAVHALSASRVAGLLIDDWQWADDASRELWALEAGAPAGPGLPCVLVHRSGELRFEALQQRRRWVDEGLVRTLSLRPLDPLQSQGLLMALLPLLQPKRSPASATVQAELGRIVERCAGHPLFLIETLRHGRSEAALLPASVSEVVVARARALGPGVRRVLEAASLVGEAFTARLLAAVLGQPELSLVPLLEHAVAAGLLQSEGQGRLRYAHDLQAQAVADSLSAVRRSALHGQLARALADADAEPGRIAAHHLLAGEPVAAAPWHLAAARLALQRRAWEQAEAAARAPALAEAPSALQVQAGLVVATARLRRSDTAGAALAADDAWRIALRADAASVLEVGLLRADIDTSRGRGDEALRALAQLESDPALDEPQRRRLLRQRAATLSYLGRHGDALRPLEQLLEATPSSAVAETMQLHDLLARTCYWAGDREAARRHIEHSLDLARRMQDDAGIARNLHRLGVLQREWADTAESDQLLIDSAVHARRAGHTEVLRSALSTLATTRLDQMRLDEAEALVTEGEQAAPYWESLDVESVFDERRLRLHQLRGEIDQAWRVIGHSLSRHRAGGHLHSQLGTLIQALRMALATEEPARARAFMSEARALHEAAGADSLHGQDLEAAEVPLLRAEGRAAEACAVAEAWLAAPHKRSAEERLRLLAAAAEAALDIGEAERAGRWLAQSRELPLVSFEIEAALVIARLRWARQAGEAAALRDALAHAHEWLGRPVLPALERARLVRVLGAGGA
jgi:hypothetical protein